MMEYRIFTTGIYLLVGLILLVMGLSEDPTSRTSREHEVHDRPDQSRELKKAA